MLSPLISMEGWTRHLGGIPNSAGNPGEKRHLRRESRRDSRYSAGIPACQKTHPAGIQKTDRDKLNSGGTRFLQPGFGIPPTGDLGGDSRPEASVR